MKPVFGVFAMLGSMMLLGCETAAPSAGSREIGATEAWTVAVGDVIVRPQIIKSVPPKYPKKLLAEHIAGSATVSFTVLVSGRTAHVKVESATHPLFGEAVVAAIEQWIFAPGKVDGRLVNTSNIIQFIEFSLPNEAAQQVAK